MQIVKLKSTYRFRTRHHDQDLPLRGDRIEAKASFYQASIMMFEGQRAASIVVKDWSFSNEFLYHHTIKVKYHTSYGDHVCVVLQD